MRGDKFCSMCRRRPKEEGGSGNCPINASLVKAYRKSEAVFDEGHSCPSFKLGDALVKRPKPTQEESLL